MPYGSALLCHIVSLALERKRPAVGSQVFVPGSQGTAWGLGSEKHTSRAPDETIRLSSTVVYTVSPQWTGEAKTMGSS